MKTLNVPQWVLELMLEKWEKDQGGPPKYRFARCWGCGKRLLFGMWHVFFRRDQREAHLCRQCGETYEVSR